MSSRRTTDQFCCKADCDANMITLFPGVAFHYHACPSCKSRLNCVRGRRFGDTRTVTCYLLPSATYPCFGCQRLFKVVRFDPDAPKRHLGARLSSFGARPITRFRGCSWHYHACSRCKTRVNCIRGRPFGATTMDACYLRPAATYPCPGCRSLFKVVRLDPDAPKRRRFSKKLGLATPG